MLCKGMAVTVDACGLHTSALVVFIEHMIASAFRELLTEDVAEEEVVIAFMLSVFQVLGEDIDHSPIEWHDQRLSVLRDVDVDDVVIKIEVLDLNVHKTLLPYTCAEKEIRHNPTLIFGKGAFLNIRLFEKQLQFLFVIGFDMTFIDLDYLHFEVWKIALIHKEMEGCYEVTKIGIDADVVIES